MCQNIRINIFLTTTSYVGAIVCGTATETIRSIHMLRFELKHTHWPIIFEVTNQWACAVWYHVLHTVHIRWNPYKRMMKTAPKSCKFVTDFFQISLKIFKTLQTSPNVKGGRMKKDVRTWGGEREMCEMLWNVDEVVTFILESCVVLVDVMSSVCV